jgi:hypothetical protein
MAPSVMLTSDSVNIVRAIGWKNQTWTTSRKRTDDAMRRHHVSLSSERLAVLLV